MKIIDEKGRLFGKINLIDLLAIVLVLALAAVLVLKFAGPKDGETAAEGDVSTLSYTVMCRMVNNDIAEYIEQTQVGMPLMSNGDILEGCKIENVLREAFYESYVTDAGEYKKAESDEYCNLVFVIAGEAPFTANAYKVGSQEVRVGKSHIVKTVDFELNGTVTAMFGDALLEGENG